jgi:hypothetical protein
LPRTFSVLKQRDLTAFSESGGWVLPELVVELS